LEFNDNLTNVKEYHDDYNKKEIQIVFEKTIYDPFRCLKEENTIVYFEKDDDAVRLFFFYTKIKKEKHFQIVEQTNYQNDWYVINSEKNGENRDNTFIDSKTFDVSNHVIVGKKIIFVIIIESKILPIWTKAEQYVSETTNIIIDCPGNKQ